MPRPKPAQPPIRRSTPPPKSHYSDYIEDLRRDFYNSCAYCTVMEREAGGVGLTIDHYIPRSVPAGKCLAHSYANLILACADCNRFKSDYYPNDTQRERGLFVIRPDEMVPNDHLEIDDDDLPMLQGKTPTGEFNIEKLDLNRPGLKKLRRNRLRLDGYRQFVQEGIRALRSVAIDRLGRRQRAKFIKLRNEVLRTAEDSDKDFDELISNFARSSLRPVDPDKKARARARKRRLEKLQGDPEGR